MFLHLKTQLHLVRGWQALSALPMNLETTLNHMNLLIPLFSLCYYLVCLLFCLMFVICLLPFLL